MSRVAKAPVNLPKGVDVTINGQNIEVKGAKGTLSTTHFIHRLHHLLDSTYEASLHPSLVVYS